jgi:hypothetical protein
MKKLLIILLIIFISISTISAKEEKSPITPHIEVLKDSSIIFNEISEIEPHKNNIGQFFGDLGTSTLEILNSEDFLNSALDYGVGMAFATVLIITVPPVGVLTMATLKTLLIKTSVISATGAVAFWIRSIIKESLKVSKAETCMKISNNNIIFVDKLLLKEGNLVVYDGVYPITFEYKNKIITTNDKGYIESVKFVVTLKTLSHIGDKVI